MQKNNIKFKHFVLFWIVSSYTKGPFEKIAELRKPPKHGILAPPGAKAVEGARRKRELEKNLEMLLREITRTANLMRAYIDEIKAKNPNAELEEEQGGMPRRLPLVGLLAKGTYAAALKACVEKNEDLFKKMIEAAAWSQKVILSKELKVKEVLRRLKNIDEVIAKKYSVVWLSEMSNKIIDPSIEASSAYEIDPDIVEALYQYCKSAMQDMEEKYHTMLVAHAKELKMEAEKERLNDVVLKTYEEEDKGMQPTIQPEEELEPEEESTESKEDEEESEASAEVELKDEESELRQTQQKNLDEELEDEESQLSPGLQENAELEDKNEESESIQEEDIESVEEITQEEAVDEEADKNADQLKSDDEPKQLDEPLAEPRTEETSAEEEPEPELEGGMDEETENEEPLEPEAEPEEAATTQLEEIKPTTEQPEESIIEPETVQKEPEETSAEEEPEPSYENTESTELNTDARVETKELDIENQSSEVEIPEATSEAVTKEEPDLEATFKAEEPELETDLVESDAQEADGDDSPEEITPEQEEVETMSTKTGDQYDSEDDEEDVL